MSTSNGIRNLLMSHKRLLNMESIEVESGELIIRQGDPVENLWLVEEGSLVVEIVQSEESNVIAVVGAGELLGEMGIFGDQSHTANVRAIETPTKLLSMKKGDFLQALLYDVDLAGALLRISQKRCQRSNELIGLMTSGMKSIVTDEVKQFNSASLALGDYGPEGVAIGELLKKLKSKSQISSQ